MDGDTDATSELRIYAGRRTIDEKTILHIESMDGNKERVKFILSEFAGKNLLVKVDTNKETALHLAAFYGHSEVVEVLIDAARKLHFTADHDPHNLVSCFEAFVRQANHSMNTALHVAVSNGNWEIAKLLAYADPSDRQIQNRNGDTPIYLAAKLGHNDIVKMLCQACTNPTLDGPEGTTALHAAIIKLNDAKQKDKNAVKAIIDAARRLPPPCSEDAICSSFEAFFNKTYKNDKDTALHLAVRGNHVDVVAQILEADPGYRGKLGDICSADNRYLNGGVYKNRDLKTLIYMAAERGYKYKAMVNLLGQTYDVGNSLGHKGQIALRAAIIGRDKGSVCDLLRDSKRLVTYADGVGWTPLHYAAFHNFDEVLEVIVTTQTSVGYQPVYGEMVPPPLCVAAKEGHTSTVIQLLKLLPDSSCVAVSYEGRNILHFAAIQSNKEMIHSILRYCPSQYTNKIINDKDVNGDTPLHVLIREGCFIPDFIKHHLVQTMARNNENWTAFDMLYFQDEIVADQLQIKKAVDDIQANQHWKWWRGSIKMKSNKLECSVPVSTRSTKDTKFKIIENMAIKEELELYAKRTNTQIIVTALIATVTFTVGFTMPGGYYQSGEDDQGLVILSKKKAFNVFMVADASALVLSISSLFLYFISSMYQDPHLVSKLNAASTGLNIVSVIAMMLTFITGTYVVLSHAPALAITVCAISCFFFILVIVLSIKLISDHKPGNLRLPETEVRPLSHEQIVIDVIKNFELIAKKRSTD